ncbi:MAG: amino acid permease [Gammaproteobacteria bacterium]|nr:amino acid permease [Gammaproteobacteria bacterium]
MATTKFKYPTVIAVVIANMVGTGVFTSLGFQLLEIRSGFALLLLWAVGGLIALCGAMTYAELGSAMPRSGGEYNFLTRIYHPAFGFVSGWVSATVGFAGPTALAAITFAAYATAVLPQGAHPWLLKLLACGLILALTALHSGRRRNSGGTQVIFTVLKIAVIVVFCIAAVMAVDVPEPVRFMPTPDDIEIVTGGAFAVALIYVSYAYTGWNAATYLSGELENPQKTLPWILISGTLVVMALYLALNFVFLRVTPMQAMVGQVEVGYITADAAFGATGGRFAGLVLSMLLISTVSAMTVAGPRVLQVIGQDFHALRLLAHTNSDGVPGVAIVFQSSLAILFILTSSFESVLVFSGFILALNSFATVLGVFVLRLRQPELARPYRTFLYPLTPLLYLALTGWTLLFVLIERPVEALFGLGIIASGLLLYAIFPGAARP